MMPAHTCKLYGVHKWATQTLHVIYALTFRKGTIACVVRYFL